MGSITRLDRKPISKDIENLNLTNLTKAYRRLKRTTRGFKSQNLREPFDFIDFEVNLDEEIRGLKHSIECGDYHPQRPFVHFSPKSKGINRPTISLHIEDAIVYRFCIQEIDKQIIEITRQKNIRGGVMVSPKFQPDDEEFYEKWFKDWMDHQKSIYEALKRNNYIVTTDISAYFDNVDLGVLKELLRDLIKGKPNLLSLLFYFLENSKLRYGYKTTLNTGLLLDDIECSRLLAYFYLHPHDIRMTDFCNRNSCFFFRYVDDMTFAVKTEILGKKALKELTNSLRELGLLSSIEKTAIVSKDKALEEMFYYENEELSSIEGDIMDALSKGEDLSELSENVEKNTVNTKKRS